MESLKLARSNCKVALLWAGVLPALLLPEVLGWTLPGPVVLSPAIVVGPVEPE